MSWRDKAVAVSTGSSNPSTALASSWRDKAVAVSAPVVPLPEQVPPTPKQEAGYAESVGAGFNQLASGIGQLAAVYGITDPSETANFVANQNKAFGEIRQRYPENVKQQIGNIEQSDGFFSTIGNVVSNPRGASYLVTEQLAQSVPTIAGGAAGAYAGSAAGGLAGSVVPGVGNAVGAAGGGLAGGFTGAFGASIPVEVGAWVNQALSQRGVDINDANALRQAYANKPMMDEIRGEAERKGVTTAAVDAAFNLFAGKFLSSATGMSLPKRIVSGVKDIGVQSVGEMASEGAGQVAAYKGDLSKVSGADIALEGILTLPQSAAESAGGAILRGNWRDKATQVQQPAAPETAPPANVSFRNGTIVIPDQAQPVVEATQDSIGIKSALSDFGKGVADSFYQGWFDTLSNGKNKSSAFKNERLFGATKQAYDNGLIQSPAQLKDFLINPPAPPIDRGILEQALASQDTTAEDLVASLPQEQPQQAEAPQVEVGKVIEQVVDGQTIRGTVQQIVQIGDNTAYVVQDAASDAPVFVDSTDAPVNVIGDGKAIYTPAQEAPAPATRDELATALDVAAATDKTITPPPPEQKPAFKDQIASMTQADLVGVYNGRNRQKRELAREELERRFPGWNMPKALDVAAAAAEVNPEPTEAQKEAGNYQKGHVSMYGLNITIENQAGSERRGVGQDGNEWSVQMPAHYGYIKRTEGADGDHMDVYLGPNAGSQKVFIVDQIDPTTLDFDEHKILLGFDSIDEAAKTYRLGFSDGTGAQRMGAITPMNMGEFKQWLKDTENKNPMRYEKPQTQAPVAVSEQPTPPAVVDTPPSPRPVPAQPDAKKSVFLNERIRPSFVSDMIENGHTTATGRKNTPFPELGNVDTPRKRINALKKVDAWLFSNAVEEAQSRGDNFNLLWLQRALSNLNNVSQADRDSAEAYMFDKAYTKQETQPEPPAPQEQEQTPAPEIADVRQDEQVSQPVIEEPAAPTPTEAPAVDEPQQPAEQPADDAADTTKTSTPRARKLEDVGEAMAGKRAQTKKSLDDMAGAEAAKEIIRLTAKKNVWKEPIAEATSGAKAYNAYINNAIQPFSGWFRDQYMYSSRRKYSADYGVSWEDKLKKLFDPVQATPESDLNRIRDAAAKYAEVVSAYSTALAEAKDVADARRINEELLVDRSDPKRSAWSYPMSAFGKEMYDYFYNGTLGYDFARKLISTHSWPGGMSDETEKRARVAKTLARPSLENVERQGLKDYREGRDITPQEFKDTFGFRGVEFGEWVRAAEGQSHVNYAYDALMDLAKRLNISPSHISLGGKLGFAFGSRGSGEHAAHFEPDNNVINLTKTKGDGSVAHEWSHALDHALSKDAGGKSLVKDVYVNLKYQQMQRDKIEDTIKSFLRGETFYQNMRRSFTKSDMAAHYLKQIYSFPTQWRIRRVSQTSFSEQADALGKNYWGLDRELFARGFEAFIYDTLGGQSPYLVNNWVADGYVTKENGYRGTTYPTGAERSSFNEIFDEFVNAIEFTDEGPKRKEGAFISAAKNDQEIADFARELEKKLPAMAKEVEDGQRSIQRPSVSESVSSGNGGTDTSAVSSTQGEGSATGTTGRSDAAGGNDVSGDAGTNQEAGSNGGAGGGAPSGRGGVRGDDTVPAAKEIEYAAEEIGEAPPAVQGKGTNHSIAVGALDERRSQRQKAKDNIEIIKLVKELETQGRAATDEEQQLLAKYTGWGSIADSFPNAEGNFKDGWKEIGEELKGLLTESEYKTALRTIQYAHYTSEIVVRSMWAGMKRLGLKSGSVFEPGMGVGNFAGMMPTDLKSSLTFAGLEVDPMTARVARQLYPQASVRIADFARAAYPDNMFDAAIGNPPFSDMKVKSDPKYADKNLSLHNYFFAKTLDMVAPGGVLAFVTSRYTMDAVDPSARKMIAEKADLVGAIRLPNTAFKTNAHTDVVTDIIFLRKRLPGETPLNMAWQDTKTNPRFASAAAVVDIQTNEYFINHPEMVLGEQVLTRSQYRENDYTVDPVEAKNLQEQLAEAIQRLPQDIVTSVLKDDTAGKDLTPTETKEGAYYLKDGALMQVEDGIGIPVKLRGSGVEGGMTKGDLAKVKALVPVRDALRKTLDAMSKKDGVEAAQKELSKHYEAFVKEYGPVTKVEIEERTPPPAAMETLRNEMREDYIESGREFDEGDINLSGLVDKINPSTGKKYSLYEIAAIRQQRREEIEASGKQVYEGTFNPDDVAPIVTERYPNLDVFRADPEYYNLMILEDYDPATGKASKRPIFERNIIADIQKPRIETATDAMNYSLSVKNKIDPDFMAQELGKPASSIIDELESKSLIFRLPAYDGSGQPAGHMYVSSDDYLSGKVKDALKYAEMLAKADPYYQKNVEALLSVQPKDVPVSEISTVLGAPYFDTQVVVDFAEDKLGLLTRIKHSSVGNIWQVLVRNRWDTNNSFTWGTSDMDAGEILENILSKRTIAIYDTVRDSEGKETRVLNTQATENAREKARLIQEAFDEWIWKSKHADAVHKKYNDDFNNVVPRKYDGSHLTPTHSPEIKLRPHQKNFVWRVLQSGNSYAAHAVGAGKTLEMAVAGMEMRRLGLWRKPMYVVPNHMLAQFAGEFRAAYPQAKIYVADEFRFHTHRRRKFVAQVAKGDWDAVVITYAAFKKIPVSQQFEAEMVRLEIDRYRAAFIEAGGSEDDLKKGARGNRLDRSQKRLQKQIQKMEERFAKLKTKDQDQSFTFEQLGVDALLVDEAHTFRKLSFATLQGNLKGVDPTGSKGSWDLYIKTKFLDTIHPGRNLVLASGTPLTNTVGEAFTIQRFMNERQLVERGIDNFDAWASTFATSVTNLEKQPSGKYANVTRLARFTNLPALSMMIREFMDVVTGKQLGMLVNRPNMKSGQIIIRTSEPTKSFKSYQKFLEKRMQAIQERNGAPQPGDDIILKVINDGRHAAIDMRLIDPTLPEEKSKLEAMISSVFDTWKESSNNEYDTKYNSGKKSPVKGGTQIVFSDLGIKMREKDGKRFSAYSHLKKKLIELGVPAEQIAFMRDYDKSDEKRRLFARMNAGEVRILIGSTSNMGTGVNVQNRLVAIHNLDAPWLPADLEQRIGRGLRQGNQNKEIAVYGYGTEGSYDSTMWGILETKANAVTQFLSGETRVTEMDDIEDTDSFRLAKALTSGDPRVLEQASLMQELSRLERKAKGYMDEQARSRREIGSKKEGIERLKNRVMRLQDEVLPKRQDVRGDKFTMNIQGKEFKDRTEAGDALLLVAKGIAQSQGSTTGNGVKVGEFGGFDMRLYIGSSNKLALLDEQFELFLDAPYISDETYAWGTGKAFNASGMTIRLSNVLDSVEKEIARSQEAIEQATRAIGQLEANLSGDFPQMAELVSKREKLSQLEKDLQSNAVAEEVIDEWPDELPGRNASAFSIVSDEEFTFKRRGSAQPQTIKAQIEKSITAHLKKVGWPDMQVVIGDEIKSPMVADQNIAGSYWNRIIYLSMQADPIATLNHELIHALKEVGAFTPAEWKLLNGQAKAWRSKYGIDTKYAEMGLSEDKLNEEAIADAFKDYGTQGAFRRIINRVKRFLEAIVEVLRTGKWDFQRPEEVFEAIMSGKVAQRRDTSSAREQRVRYAIEEQKDPVKALEEAQENLDELLATRVRGFNRDLPTDLSTMAAFIIHPRQIASLDEDFTPVYQNAVNQFEMRDQIIHELSNYVETYNQLSAKSKERVNAILELGRLDGKTFSLDENKQLTFKNTSQENALFTKVGQSMVLDETETKAYFGVRRAMNKALDIYIEQILDDYGYLESGINTKAKLVKAIAKETNAAEQERMAMALKMIDEIEQAKRKGYAPLKRWGNVGIVVKEIDQDKPEGDWKVEHYEQLDVNGLTDMASRAVKKATGKSYKKIGSQEQVKEALARLAKQYPEGQYQIITFPVGSFSDLEGKLNLRDLDVLAASSDLSQDEYARLRGAIEDSLKRRGFKAHFYKSNNISGYSPDFERAINDYIVGIAGHLARRRWAPKIDRAIQKIAAKKVKPKLVKYAQNYQTYIQNPQEEFQHLRQVGFLYYIAGSLASAVTNLTQVPMVTVPWLSGVAGAEKASSAVASAYKDTSGMFAFPRTGLEVFDPNKAPADMRDEIVDAWEKGHFVPLNTYEAMAIANTNSAALRGFSRMSSLAMNWIAVKFSAAERMNRLTTFIAAYRIAKDPANRKAIEEFVKNDALGRKEVLEGDEDGFARRFADYAVVSTQFYMGRVNRPTMFRSVGAILFQFKGFMLQLLEMQYRMMKIHGKNGRKTIGMMMVLLIMASGIMGLPFAEDMKDIIEAIYKRLTRKDIDLETEARDILGKYLTPQIAEALMRGLPRVLIDIDLGRLGFGDILPDNQNEMWGVWYDMLMRFVEKVPTEVARGDYAQAMAAALPNFIGNIIKGADQLGDGIKSMASGNTVIAPDELRTFDGLMKMAGFTTGRVAEMRQRQFAENRAQRAADDLRRDYYDRLAIAKARQIRAFEKGEADKSDAYEAEFQGIINEIERSNVGVPQYKQVIINERALRQRIKEELAGTGGKKTKVQARSRIEELRQIYTE